MCGAHLDGGVGQRDEPSGDELTLLEAEDVVHELVLVLLVDEREEEQEDPHVGGVPKKATEGGKMGGRGA